MTVTRIIDIYVVGVHPDYIGQHMTYLGHDSASRMLLANAVGLYGYNRF